MSLDFLQHYCLYIPLEHNQKNKTCWFKSIVSTPVKPVKWFIPYFSLLTQVTLLKSRKLCNW